jgi:hypothetical protein
MGVVVPAPERPCSGQWRLGSTSKRGTFVGCYRPEDVLGKGFSVIFRRSSAHRWRRSTRTYSGARCRPSARPPGRQLRRYQHMSSSPESARR